MPVETTWGGFVHHSVVQPGGSDFLSLSDSVARVRHTSFWRQQRATAWWGVHASRSTATAARDTCPWLPHTARTVRCAWSTSCSHHTRKLLGRQSRNALHGVGNQQSSCCRRCSPPIELRRELAPFTSPPLIGPRHVAFGVRCSHGGEHSCQMHGGSDCAKHRRTRALPWSGAAKPRLRLPHASAAGVCSRLMPHPGRCSGAAQGRRVARAALGGRPGAAPAPQWGCRKPPCGRSRAPSGRRSSAAWPELRRRRSWPSGAPTTAPPSRTRGPERLALQSVRTAQVRMTRRIAGWWPKAGEENPQDVRRTTRWAESLWEMARGTILGSRSCRHIVALGGTSGMYRPARAHTLCMHPLRMARCLAAQNSTRCDAHRGRRGETASEPGTSIPGKTTLGKALADREQTAIATDGAGPHAMESPRSSIRDPGAANKTCPNKLARGRHMMM